MTDDLKERLKKWPTPLHGEALARITDLEARITDLEARLAAMTALHESDVENGTKLALEAINANNERAVLASRLAAAEAGEDALAEALRSYRADLCEGFCLEAEWSDEAHNNPAMQRDCGGCLAAAALAAYEARRG